MDAPSDVEEEPVAQPTDASELQREVAALRDERDQLRTALSFLTGRLGSTMAQVADMVPAGALADAGAASGEFVDFGVGSANHPTVIGLDGLVSSHARNVGFDSMTPTQARVASVLQRYRTSVDSDFQMNEDEIKALEFGEPRKIGAQSFPHAVRREAAVGEPLCQYVFVHDKTFTLRMKVGMVDSTGIQLRVQTEGDLLEKLNLVSETPENATLEFELILLQGTATAEDLFNNRRLFSFAAPDGNFTLKDENKGKITTASGAHEYSIFQPAEKSADAQTPKNRWIGKWNGCFVKFLNVAINPDLKSSDVNHTDMRTFRFGVRCIHPGAKGFRNFCAVSQEFKLHTHHLGRLKERKEPSAKKRKKADAAEGAEGVDEETTAAAAEEAIAAEE